MFDWLATALSANPAIAANLLFAQHPQNLSSWLEEAWASFFLPPARGNPQDILGSPAPGIINGLVRPGPAAPGGRPPSGLPLPVPNQQFLWHDLIYSYLIESTGVVEVMSEVIRRILVGETLDALTVAGQQWVRSTHSLFFSEAPPFQVLPIGGLLRPEGRIARRNAYWRMYSMDLPHPLPPSSMSAISQPWKLDVGAGVNTGFRAQWTDFLRQVWQGLENRTNLSGAKSTDPSYVALLAESIRDMMRLRRRGGQLVREEAAYASMMTWFQITLATDTPIIVDLNATAVSPEERLIKLAQRVGMAPAPRSRELFLLALPASELMRDIELGAFATGALAAALFPIVGTPLSARATDVIDLWQSATGERIKDGRLTSTGGTPPQPLRLPTAAAPVPVPVGTTNGRSG